MKYGLKQSNYKGRTEECYCLVLIYFSYLLILSPFKSAVKFIVLKMKTL